MRASLKVSFITFFFSFLFIIAYYVLRWHFTELYPLLPLKSLGLAAWLIFLPEYLEQLYKFQPKKLWYAHHNIISLYGLLIICFAGWAGLAWAAYIFGIAGFFFFILLLYKHVKSFKTSHLITFLMMVFFGSWLIGTVWRGIGSNPLFLEALVVSNFEDLVGAIDILYHSSMSEMIRTYNIPSTGIDGLPSMYYHYGSHWVFAQVANFFDTEVLQVYLLVYASVFIPFFFKIFLIFILDIRSNIDLNTTRDKFQYFGYWFWLLFLCIFIQIIKHLYSGGYLGYNILPGESYMLSITLMFILFSTGLLYFNKNDHKKLFLWIFLPLMIIAIGFLKVSTMFIVCGLVGYLFIRLNFWKRTKYIVGVFLCIIGFVFTYFMVTETIFFSGRNIGYEGNIDWFYFYTHHDFDPLSFFFLFYLWAYIFLALIFFLKKTSHPSINTLSAEILIVVIIVGIVPTSFLVLTGGNAMYFLNVQLFIAAAFLLAYLPCISINIPFKWLNKSIAILFSIGVFLLLYMHTRFALGDLLRHNITVREKIENTQISYDRIFKGFYKSLYTSKNLEEKLSSNEGYKFIKNLRRLAALPLEIKQQSVVQVNLKKLQSSIKIKCAELDFLVPAITGIVQTKSIPVDCFGGALGFEYYIERPENVKSYNDINELRKYKENRNFNFFWIYNESRKEFIKYYHEKSFN